MKKVFAAVHAAFGVFRDAHAARRDVWESGTPILAALSSLAAFDQVRHCADSELRGVYATRRADAIAALSGAIGFADHWRNLPGAAELSGAAAAALESILYPDAANA